MDGCRYCAATRERIDEMAEELRQLRALLAGDDVPLPGHLVHLTTTEQQIMRLLMARPVLTKDAYLAVREADDWDGDPKIFDVLICRLRKKLAPFGVAIDTVWGQGRSLSPPMKDLVRELAARPAPPPSDVPAQHRAPVGCSPQRYEACRSAVIDALSDAPLGLTWPALARAANLGETKLQQALSGLLNAGSVRRDFARAGNVFVYSLHEERAA